MTRLLAAGGDGEFNVLAVPLDKFIMGTICFLIVFGVLGKMLLPKIKKALDEREEAIEGGLRRAEEAQAESAKLKAGFQDQLASAREEASAIRTQAQAERAGMIEQAKSDAIAAAALVTAAAMASIEAEKAKTISELRKSVGTMATDLAGRIVGEVLTDDARAQAVVNAFIIDVEQVAAEASSESV